MALKMRLPGGTFQGLTDIGVTGERHQTLQAQAYSKHLLPFKSRMFSALTVTSTFRCHKKEMQKRV